MICLLYRIQWSCIVSSPPTQPGSDVHEGRRVANPGKVVGKQSCRNKGLHTRLAQSRLYHPCHTPTHYSRVTPGAPCISGWCRHVGMAEMAGPASEAVHIGCGSNFFPRLASQEHADWLQYEQMIMAEPGTSLAQPEPSDPEFLRRCAKKAGLSADLLDDLVDAAELNDLNALSVCHLEVDDAADKLFLTQDEAKALLKVCKRQCQLAGVDFGDGTEVAPRTPEDDWEWCPAQPQPPVSALTPPQPLQLATGKHGAVRRPRSSVYRSSATWSLAVGPFHNPCSFAIVFRPRLQFW